MEITWLKSLSVLLYGVKNMLFSLRIFALRNEISRNMKATSDVMIDSVKGDFST